MRNTVQVLEQNGAIRVLLVLLEGKKTYSELKMRIKISNTSLSRILRLLTEAGLVEEIREDSFPYRRFVSLTEKGRGVAIHLQKAVENL